jgi:hypothetical protein
MFLIRYSASFAIALMCLSMTALIGCDQKEKVIDIETPAGDIQVERSKSSGKVDVDINIDRKAP